MKEDISMSNFDMASQECVNAMKEEQEEEYTIFFSSVFSSSTI